MDKLQPIIKHRFWILFGLTLPIALYAYYSANGSLKAAAQERESAITSTLGSISSGQEPNPTFAESLKKINEVQEARVKAEIRRLWERQKSRMTWPEQIADEVPEQYRGEFELPTLLTYKGLYPSIIEDVYEYAEPVPVDDTEPTWKPKLVMSPSVIPRKRFGKLTISSEDMWDAQEDTWFLRVLLDAVRDMNADADNIATAVIRRIDRLELLGGTGESSVVAGVSGAGGSGGFEGYEDPAMIGMAGEYESGGSGGGGFGVAQGKVAFDPAEELGTQIDSSAAPAGGSAGGYGEMEMPMAGSVGGQQNLLRYVAFDESAPFQERGFYMSIIIDETKIPEFLVRLSNSEWPIRLLRFHMGPNPYATAAGRRMVDTGGLGSYGEYASEMEAGYVESGYAEPMGSSPMPMGGTYGSPASGGMANPRGKYAALAAGALSHPNLVQVDLCGVITMYKPPAEDVLEATDVTGQQATDATADPAASGADVVDPAAAEEPADSATAEDASAAETPADAERPAEDDSTGADAPAATDQTAPAGDTTPQGAAGEPATDDATGTEAAAGASEEE